MTIMDTGLTITVSGKAYPVTLSTDQHAWVKARFSLHLGDDNDVTADSFAELETKVKDLRLIRFELPFTTYNGRDGKITGYHATNNAFLVKWDDGGHSQERQSYLASAMPKLSEAERIELNELSADVRKAQKAVDDFIAARKFKDITAAADEARRLAGGISA